MVHSNIYVGQEKDYLAIMRHELQDKKRVSFANTK